MDVFVDIVVTTSATTTVKLQEGETVLELANRNADVYLHGRGEDGCADKDDLGGNTQIDVIKVYTKDETSKEVEVSYRKFK